MLILTGINIFKIALLIGILCDISEYPENQRDYDSLCFGPPPYVASSFLFVHLSLETQCPHMTLLAF